MNEKNENAPLLAVVKIRELVSSSVEEWNQIKVVGREIDLLTKSTEPHKIRS